MSAEAGSAFDVYRQRVERPLYRLFTEYGPGRLKWLTVGMVANVLARGASLLPPLVLGVAIDSVLNGNEPYKLPLVPSGWLPTTDPEQFWFSVWIIVGSFVVTAVFTWIYGVVHESEVVRESEALSSCREAHSASRITLVQPTRTQSVLVTPPTTLPTA